MSGGRCAEQGGGPLFGVNGIGIIGHGRSKAENISHSIFMATQVADTGLIDAMRKDLLSTLGIVGSDISEG